LTITSLRKEIPKVSNTKAGINTQDERRFETDSYEINSSFENISNQSLDKLLVNCYRGKNLKNLIFYSIFAKPNELYSYILSFYDEGGRKDDLYMLLMLKSGNLETLVKEQKDYLYEKFYTLLFLLLENINHFSEELIKTFLQYLLRENSQYVRKFDLFIENHR
jgi:hypothetical protein